jgi:hypothetical protein
MIIHRELALASPSGAAAPRAEIHQLSTVGSIGPVALARVVMTRIGDWEPQTHGFRKIQSPVTLQPGARDRGALVQLRQLDPQEQPDRRRPATPADGPAIAHDNIRGPNSTSSERSSSMACWTTLCCRSAATSSDRLNSSAMITCAGGLAEFFTLSWQSVQK